MVVPSVSAAVGFPASPSSKDNADNVTTVRMVVLSVSAVHRPGVTFT